MGCIGRPERAAMNDYAIRKMVIVGGGTAGWMTAAAFSRVFGALPGLHIELVESDAIGTVGVGEASIPDICLFNNLLGIDENEFVRQTGATYKLGIEFVDWTRLGHRYVHPFGHYGIDMMGIEFQHFWLKGKGLGDNSLLDAYSMAAVAGKAGRFMRPHSDQPNSPLSKFSYAFQFDAGRYAKYLRARAEAQGVKRTEGKITKVEQDNESGFVTAVVLENGTHITGELFRQMAGLELSHIPYKGVPEVITDAMAARLNYAFAPIGNTLPFIKERRLAALGVSTAARSAALPDVPTIAEAGLAGYVFDHWYGLFAPAKTPRPVVSQVSQEVARILNIPDVKDKIIIRGAAIKPSKPDEFDQFVRSEVAKITKVMQAGGVKVQ